MTEKSKRVTLKKYNSVNVFETIDNSSGPKFYLTHDKIKEPKSISSMQSYIDYYTNFFPNENTCNIKNCKYIKKLESKRAIDWDMYILIDGNYCKHNKTFCGPVKIYTFKEMTINKKRKKALEEVLNNNDRK